MEEHRLMQIARHLILNSSYLDNLGLFHGKIGIVLFFAHYAKYSANSLYDDFAGELLKEIYDDVDSSISIDFENGLSGIGWGINYLLQHSFMPGDANEILGDLDKIIMERDLRRITDLSLRKGLLGISCYVQSRIDLVTHNSQIMPFDEMYLSDWKEAVKKHSINTSLYTFKNLLKELFHEDGSLELLGLENGYAGAGLSLLLR